MPDVVGGVQGIAVATFSRPDDTATYAINDVVADSTSAPTVMTFRNFAPSGSSGVIQSASLFIGETQALKLDADLFLFSVAPASYGNDNAAFTPTDAELANLVGVINFAAGGWSVGDATSGLTGNCVNYRAGLGMSVKLKPSVPDVYGVLVARNAYIPAGPSPIRAILHVLRDL